MLWIELIFLYKSPCVGCDEMFFPAKLATSHPEWGSVDCDRRWQSGLTGCVSDWQVDGELRGLPGDYEKRDIKCPTVGELKVFIQVSTVFLASFTRTRIQNEKVPQVQFAHTSDPTNWIDFLRLTHKSTAKHSLPGLAVSKSVHLSYFERCQGRFPLMFRCIEYWT